MRKITRIVAPLVITLLTVPLAAATKDPKPADLLTKAASAMGGGAMIDSIKTLELHGSSKRVLPNGEEWSLTTVSYYQFPDRYRKEATLPIGGTLITIVSPQGAFLQTGQSGGIQLPDEQKTEISRSILRNPVALLQRRATLKPTVEGKQKIDGKDAVVLQIKEDIGTTKVALDAKTGEILQITYPTAGGLDSKQAEMTVSYSDYRQVGKLRFPYSSTGLIAGKPAFTFHADKVLVNETVKEGLFTPAPAAPEPPATATTGSAAPATTGTMPAMPPMNMPMPMPGMPANTTTTSTQPPAKPPKQ